MPSKPTHPKLIQERGGFDKRYHSEPNPIMDGKPGVPAAPQQIKRDPIAIEIWMETCEALDELGLLNETDRFLVASYVLNAAELTRVVEGLRDSGHVWEGRGGSNPAKPSVHPNSTVYQKLMKMHVDMLDDLGLTPGGRIRLAGEVAPKDDPIEAILTKLSGKN